MNVRFKKSYFIGLLLVFFSSMSSSWAYPEVLISQCALNEESWIHVFKWPNSSVEAWRLFSESASFCKPKGPYPWSDLLRARIQWIESDPKHRVYRIKLPLSE